MTPAAAAANARRLLLAGPGRVIEGVAVAYNRPARVSDDGGRTRYWEEFAPGCFDHALAARDTWPLGVWHPWTPGSEGNKECDNLVPLGSVTFTDTGTELWFSATIAHGPRGDTTLELIELGAMSDVSIGARGSRYRTYRNNGRTITRRTHIEALTELSLAPTGFGQRPEASIRRRLRTPTPTRTRTPTASAAPTLRRGVHAITTAGTSRTSADPFTDTTPPTWHRGAPDTIARTSTPRLDANRRRRLDLTATRLHLLDP